MIPEKIGRYIINSELGRGGMATVFRANDPNFGRDVAIKILPRTFLHDPQFRTRFEREAKTIAALEHSAIVPVYDFGEDDGQPFIVMRLMTGGSLAERLENDNLSLEEAVKVTTQLAPGLDAAHKSGIIHRDLKPGNILFDQYDNAYLSDFGIARLTEGDGTLTGTSILGTPAYMSPEQIQGGQEIDNRSDLYSLGIIFYHMLVGHTPYEATTPAKVMMMHILEPVPDIMDSMPDIPPGIEDWLKKALAKEPDDRFSTAVEMANALQDAVEGKYPSGARKAVIAPEWGDDTKGTIPISTGQTSAQQAQASVSAAQTIALKRKSTKPIIIGTAIVIGIIAISAIALVLPGLNGSGPLAMLASSTSTATTVPATKTPKPFPTEVASGNLIGDANPSSTPTIATTMTAIPDTATPEPSLTVDLLTLGGADKIAFLDSHEIWMMNIDGSGLEQLTSDGGEKSNLEWKPDGSVLTYIQGKCVYLIDYETRVLDKVACFEAAEYLENFTFSPEGDQVAISVDRRNYVVPYDLETLQAVRNNNDLIAMNDCKSIVPVPTNTKFFRFANDGERFLTIQIGLTGNLRGDNIQFLRFQNCDVPPTRIDEIPASRFTIEGYTKNPKFENFGFDGESLIALVSFTRNDGYGHLYIYNSDLHRADAKVNPIDGNCCYRDVRFSPDGRYIILVYQPYEADAKASLYYIDYSTLSTGKTYEPLPLPITFFEDPRTKPQPALRPAQE
jgi:serine/threonine protein kinase